MVFVAQPRTARILLVVGVVVVLGFCAMQLLMVVGEVGHKDIWISFVVKDGITGQPIPDASIQIRNEGGGLCGDREARSFTLTSDSSGHASYLVTGCMWSSTHGFLVNNFYMHLPHWWFSASAPGYQPTDRGFLDDMTINRQVKRERPAAQLEVPLLLFRETERNSH